MKYLLSLLLILCRLGLGDDHDLDGKCPNPGLPDDWQCNKCSSRNDPHIITLDGIPYDHHEEGCYQYITGCDGAILPFEICGCHYPCYLSSTSIMCMGDVYITFFDLTSGAPTETAYINFATPALDAVDSSNIPIPMAPAQIPFDPSCPGFPLNSAYFEYNRVGITHYFDIISGPTPKDQFYAHIKYSPGHLRVFLDDQYFPGKTCGLCGLYDLDGNNDFTGSDGVQYIFPPYIPYPSLFKLFFVFIHYCTQIIYT